MRTKSVKKSKGKKNKARGVQERAAKQAVKAPPLNPFELKYSRQKHVVVGQQPGKRKMCAAGVVVGAPTASHSRAQEDRRKKIVHELRRENRHSQMRDHRVKRADADYARFANVRAQEYRGQAEQSSGQDTEVLTHRGQSIAAYERLDQRPIRGDDSDDDDGTGAVNASFVSAAHFGGFADEHKNPNRIPLPGVAAANKRRDLISEMIAASIEKKRVKQAVAERQDILLDEIDSQWRSMNVGNCMRASLDAQERATRDDKRQMIEAHYKGMADFDATARMVQSLPSRMATATARVESTEKPDKKQNVSDGDEQQEDDETRQAYNLELPVPKKKKSEKGDDQFEVRYRDGKLINAHLVEKPTGFHKANDAQSDEESTSGEENYEDDEGSDEEVADESDDEQEDSTGGGGCADQSFDCTSSLEMPYSYKAFRKFLEEQDHNEWHGIFKQLIEHYHASKAEANKEKLRHLIEWSLDALCEEADKMQGVDAKDTEAQEKVRHRCNTLMLDAVHPLLGAYRLQVLYAASKCRALLQQLQEQHREVSNEWPSYRAYALLRLIGNTFPTADAAHCVIEPAMAYMCELLNSCNVQTPTHIANGLLIVELLLHYVRRNKRYVPELMTFLSSVVRAAVPEDAVNWRWARKCPSATFANGSTVLVVQAQEAKATKTIATKKAFHRLQSLQCQNADMALGGVEQRILVLHVALELLSKAVDLWKNNTAAYALFELPKTYLSHVETQAYPKETQKLITAVSENIEEMTNQPLIPLHRIETSVQSIEFLEPDFEPHYAPDRRKSAKKSGVNLKRAYKREYRGAMRDLRRDSAARVGVVRERQRDADRRRQTKTDAILRDLRVQRSQMPAKKKKKAL